MQPSVEGDLFYDLFGEDGFFSPVSTGSTSQDSGIGSPSSSSVDTSSPGEAMSWDADNVHDDFWGSVLDHLPRENIELRETKSNDLVKQEPVETPIPLENSGYNSLTWSTTNFVNTICSESDLEVRDLLSLLNEKEESLVSVTHDADSYVVSGGEEKYDQLINTSSSQGTDLQNVPVTKLSPYQVEIINRGMAKAIPRTLNRPIGNVDKKMAHTLDPPIVSSRPVQSTSSIHLSSKPPIILTATGKNTQFPEWIVKAAKSRPNIPIGQSMSTSRLTNNESIDEKRVNSTLQQLFNSPNHIVPKTEISPPCRSQSDTLVNRRLSSNILVNAIDHDYAEMETSERRETFQDINMSSSTMSLTEEEEMLVEKEYMRLPEGARLSKEEQKKVLKRVRRKIKNKQSAMESRKRRKVYVENLERRLMQCTGVTNLLKKKVEKLSEDNKSLVNQLKVIKGFVAATLHQSKTNNNGTCLAVLLLTFSLCILPFNPLQHFGGKSEASPTGVPLKASTSSRTLLSAEESYYHDNDYISKMYYMSYENYFSEPPTKNIKGSTMEGKPIDRLLTTNYTFYFHNFTTDRTLDTTMPGGGTKTPFQIGATAGDIYRCTPTQINTIRPSASKLNVRKTQALVS